MGRPRIALRHAPRMARIFVRPPVFTPDHLDSPARVLARLPEHRAAPWPETTPADAGMTDLDARLAELGNSDEGRLLHAAVVIRGGRVVAEHYGAGVDFRWGQRLPTVTFGPDTLHDIRSVTKSVTGLLYGIANEHGLVPDPEAPLIDHYPQHREAMRRTGKADLTLRHVLTMTMGLEWNEHYSYRDRRNGEIAMELARDRYAYILSRTRIDDTGSTWHYCGGATALLGDLIERGSGMSLARFAHEQLFVPLGIAHWQWMAGSDGRASAASALRLTPRDLARIGTLLLSDGMWEGRPVVPRAWLRQAARVQVQPTWDAHLGYGYHLYRAPAGADGPPLEWLGGIGNGGQGVMAFPDVDVVAAVTCGNYDGPGQGREAYGVRAAIAESLAS